MATPPLIGITLHPPIGPHRDDLDTLVAGIVAGVERAGGLPLLIPYGLGGDALRGVFTRLDGVLISGGGDVAAEQYGAAPDARIGGVDAARDAQEITLTRWVMASQTPLFGICRGAQVANVALGGTLYADTADHPAAQRHAYYPNLPFDDTPHLVQVAEGTLLAEVLGRPQVPVNSLHHQAVRTLAPGLRAAAHAPDGVIEAWDAPDHPFALAVQWHPEALLEHESSQRLFSAFVRAAGRGKNKER